jgi:hypothetical protein
MTLAYQWWVESIEIESGLANDVKIFNSAAEAVTHVRTVPPLAGEHYSIVLVHSRGAAMNGSLVREYAPADVANSLPKTFNRSSHAVPDTHRAELAAALAAPFPKP